MGFKKVGAVIALAGAAAFAVLSGSAQASAPSGGQRESQDVSAVSSPAATSSKDVSKQYLSAEFHRGRSSMRATVNAGLTVQASRCPAFVTWQSWLGGARVRAYVDFRPSDICNGRQVKKAYVRLIRQCGPYYDSGRIYTYTAGSRSDTRLFSVSAWIFDSVLWNCNTNTYYGYEYF